MQVVPAAEDVERQRTQLQVIQDLLAKAGSTRDYAVAAQMASSLVQFCKNYRKTGGLPQRTKAAGEGGNPTVADAKEESHEQQAGSAEAELPAQAAPHPVAKKIRPPASSSVLFHNFPPAWSVARSKAFVERFGCPVVSIEKLAGSSPPGIVIQFKDAAGLIKAVEILQWEKPDPRKPLAYKLLTDETVEALFSQAEQAEAAGISADAVPTAAPAYQPHTSHPRQDNRQGQKRERDGDRHQGQQQQPQSKRQKDRKGGRPIRTDIREAVCPWWEMTYQQQLQEKSTAVAKQLKRVTDEIGQHISSSKRPAWCSEAYGQRHGRCCPQLGILASPVRDGYRNKSEFTIGLDVEEKKTVGFLLGAYREGLTAVADPVNCRHVPPSAIAYAHIVTDFLRQHSKLPVWDKHTNSGFWRLLIVREAHHACLLPALDADNGEGAPRPTFEELDPMKWLVATTEESGKFGGVPLDGVKETTTAPPGPDEVLIMVQVDPTNASAEDAKQECTSLAAFLRSEAPKKNAAAPNVMLLQYHSGCSNAADVNTAPIMALVPEEEGQQATTIQEALGEFKFRLSATAFFQVNTPATCLLYRTAGLWASPSAETLLLDVCCGTGTIGLTMARHVKKVLGVDCVEAAVKDAEANAKLNGITNCEYVCAKVEDVMQLMLSRHSEEYKEVVVIADPPRNGLHKNVLQAILKCEKVRRMVYVSCNPGSLGDNLVHLCSARCSPDPFVPQKAVAVDLFPHTAHVESVVLLQR